MKKGTLFEQKESAITCEESMGNANEYHKLVKPPTSMKRLMKEGKQM
jgi:hypothetical protein